MSEKFAGLTVRQNPVLQPFTAKPTVIETQEQLEAVLGHLQGENPQAIYGALKGLRSYERIGTEYDGWHKEVDGTSYPCKRQLWGHPDDPNDLNYAILVEYIQASDGTCLRYVTTSNVLALFLTPHVPGQELRGALFVQGQIAAFGRNLGAVLLAAEDVEPILGHERAHAMRKEHDCSAFQMAGAYRGSR